MSDPSDKRSSPLVGQIVFFAVFAVFVVISIFTVLVPALYSEDEELRQAPRTEERSESRAP
jgi:hypothetical protein